MEEKISIILVNYNGLQYNDACIESLLGSTFCGGLQIVVVDNASTDASYAELEERWGQHPQITLLQTGENCGFAGGNNIGIRKALESEPDYIMLLNNDTVVEADAIEEMVKLQKQQGGIVTAKIKYADQPDVIWSAGGEFSGMIWKSSHTGLNQKDGAAYEQDRRCSFTNGCCMLMSRTVFEKLGYLDERFFLYYEDNEYSLRAKVRQIPIRYCHRAVVYHKVNGATKGNENAVNVFYITRNWLLCSRTYMGALRFGLFRLYFFCNRAAWVCIWAAQGRWDCVRAVREGFRAFRQKSWGRVSRSAEIEFHKNGVE